VPSAPTVAALCLAALALAPAAAEAGPFKARQLRFPRVRAAYEAREAALMADFEKLGLAWPPRRIFLRVHKHERRLEVWAGAARGPLKRVRDYEVCAASGELGPKRQQGDEQVPEGFYFVDRFNPSSNFHLSLGLDYPNQADRVHGVKGRLGGDIFVHGSCVSIGCVAITDAPIEELYVLAVEARDAGQARVPVHVFPRRLDAAGLAALAEHPEAGRHLELWRELAPGWAAFEASREPPSLTVDRDGRYRLSGRRRRATPAPVARPGAP
jgi:murein L,D-transpeptidase YafK